MPLPCPHVLLFSSTVALSYFLHRSHSTSTAKKLLTSSQTTGRRWCSVSSPPHELDPYHLHPNALLSLVLQIFASHDLLKFVDLGCFYTSLKSLTSPSRSNPTPTYQTVPYHNIRHACHVLLSTHKLFTSLRPDLEIGTSEISKLALFLSALYHDLEHDGRSNALHKAAGNKTVSPLEARSVNGALSLFPAFLRVPPEHEAEFLDLFSSLILCTDIGNADGAATLRGKQESDTYLHNVIRLADIGCVFQSYEIYTRWSSALFEEQLQCGEATSRSAFAEANPKFLSSYVQAELSSTLSLFEPSVAAEMQAGLDRVIETLEGKTVEERVADQKKYRRDLCWKLT
ncbi:hypothetical protein TeGR_g5534 [Tetraparma gracilis]|uniref:PDEase domain-containing protein n=1 Tax=Tetraparma gracilis TaxID=2962635 RepID=A0ABQ6MT26_9STRA|nr:hypothetical protein TeGR_g5534 [Tetraparma gracilis]